MTDDGNKPQNTPPPPLGEVGFQSLATWPRPPSLHMHEPASNGGDAIGRGDRLDSWKEIAAYLGRGVTTVQRWEQLEGLPVHRLPHAKKGSVFALKSELDAWLAGRIQRSEVQPTADPETSSELTARIESPPPRRWVRQASTVGLVAVVIATVLALTRSVRDRGAITAVPGVAPVVAMPLTSDAADEQCPSLSPDGTQVVYHWARQTDAGLYIKRVGAGSPRRLVTDGAGKLEECGYAKWSPTGDLIAFLTQGEAESKDLWVISPSGSEPRRLTSESGIGVCWAPDGRSLGFVDRNSRGEPFSIFVIPTQGGRRKRLTTPPLGAFGDTDCSFSPDGRRLAIVRYPNRSQSDLFVASATDSTGNAIERLTTGLGGIEGIAWSPDGHAIVLGTHHGLWRVDADSTRGKPIAFAAFEAGARYPTFSRQSGDAGTAPRLVYESNVIDVNIWRWDAATGRTSKVAGSTWWEDFPAASPDGKRLAFASDRTGDNEIWTANADGSDPQQVTFHRGPVVIAPSWSPDGTRLAFSSQVAGNRDIYVIRPDGSQSIRVTNAPTEEGSPNWSRDGRSVYYRSDQGGVGQIWKVSASGGAPTRVTAGEAYEGAESPNGQTYYFVRNPDVPGLWSVPVAGGRETLVLPEVHEGWWAMSDTGIYYFVRTPAGSPNATTLRFFEFASSRVSTVPGPPTPASIGGGLSVPRDGRFVLWTQVDQRTTDLMLIDSWKQ